MKKMFIAAAALMAFGVSQAQEVKFGIKAGADFATEKVKLEGVGTFKDSETGFYIGGFAEIGVSSKFSVQPELYYVGVNDFKQIQLPILAKYRFVDKFAIMAGPDFGFILDTPDGMKSFNFGADVALSYDITPNIIVDAKYNFGLSNLLDGGDSDNSDRISGFLVGLAYKF